MDIINISKKKFNSLTSLELDKEIVNTEALIYNFDYRGQKGIFKNFHRLNGSLFANKLFTIEMLNHYKELLPKSFVVPEKIISVNGKMMGCFEKYIEGNNLLSILNDPKIELSVKIFFLRQIGQILEELKYIRMNTDLKDVFINDLHAGNFIVNDKLELRVIDLDSCKICDNKPFPSKYLLPNKMLQFSNKYKFFDKKEDSDKEEYEYRRELGYIVSDENSDLYCYIITIMNFLYKDDVNKLTIDEFYRYLIYLVSIGIDQNLINSFERILLNCENINPVDYLATLTYEQVAKANNKVYKLV